MRKTIIFLLCLFSCASLNAQDSLQPIKKNSLFLEFCGNSVEPNNGWHDPGEHFSINYDRLLHTGKSVKTSFRIGTNMPVGNLISSGKNSHIMLAMLNLLVGKKNLYGEFGAGGELIFVNANYSRAYGAFTTVIGLRYISSDHKFILRLGLTPTLGIVAGSLYAGSLFGISIGYNF